MCFVQSDNGLRVGVIGVPGLARSGHEFFVSLSRGFFMRSGSRILRGFDGKRQRGARLSWVYDCVGQEEAAMRTPMSWRTERGRHFQAHPLQATFSLVASMLLAGLVVLALVLSVR
jgi:hypothetical protein